MRDFLENWREEKKSAFIYEKLAALEKSTTAGELFSKLSLEAVKQADIWAEKIQKEGGSLPPYRPDLRTRFILRIVGLLGVWYMKPVLAAMKVRGLSIYPKNLSQHPMPNDLRDLGKRHRGR